MSFTPQGEEAYSYLAVGSGGERYFVRAQGGLQDGHLENVYAAVAALQTACGITAAVAPYRAKQGSFTSRYGRYTMAVFPFIAGTTGDEISIPEAQWIAAAQVIASLHTSPCRCSVPIAARETFASPFAATIRRALRRAASAVPPASPYQARVIALLRNEDAAVRATLERMRQMRQTARRLAPAMVPTHGDPNLAKFLIDDNGTLHLTDWGELAWAPRERDLTFFSGQRFESALRGYVAVVGRVRLHRVLFAFYLYRWVMQEIADFTSRIVFAPSDVAEQAHAWEELQPYLPVPHASLESGLQAIMRVLTRLADERLVDVEVTSD